MVQLINIKSLNEFVERANEHNARLVKVEDYGFTAPVKRDGAVFVQPQVRVVATFFTRAKNAIFRWENIVDANTLPRTDPAQPSFNEKERVRQTLQLEGFAVEKGEWSKAAVEAILQTAS